MAAVQSRQRFSDIEWAKATPDCLVEIVGAGGIGSWTAPLLARCGYPIMLWDNDVVSMTNLGGQLFPITSCGMKKVDVVEMFIRHFCSGASITPVRGRFTAASKRTNAPIMVSALDNMETRKQVFDAWLAMPSIPKNSPIPKLLVDGRLLAEQFQVYFVTDDAEKIGRYRQSLFADEEVEEQVCSYKQSSHFAAGIAYTIVKGINNFVQNHVTGSAERFIPFLVEEEGFMFTSIQT